MSDTNAEDWARLVRQLCDHLAVATRVQDECADLLLELRDLRTRDLDLREREAANAEARLRFDEQVELARQRREDEREGRRWAWWDRACEAGRAALGSPHADRLLSAVVGAAVLGIGWAAASWWGTPPAQGGP